MADPFSVAVGCIALTNTIGKVSISIAGFVRDCRAARTDLDAVSRELGSLQTILELIAEDTSKNAIPETLKIQIEGIISNCSKVLEEIGNILEKYGKPGKRNTAEWVFGGSSDVTKLRLSLDAHKTALELALDMVQISISRDIKLDTSLIRDDTSVIRQDTAEILAQTLQLRAQLPQELEEVSPNIVLERYLADLTTYAESVQSDVPEQAPLTAAFENDKNEARPSRRLSMSSIRRSLSHSRNMTPKPESESQTQRNIHVRRGSVDRASSTSTGYVRLPGRRGSTNVREPPLSGGHLVSAGIERTNPAPSASYFHKASKLESEEPSWKPSQLSLVAGMGGCRSTPSMDAPSGLGLAGKSVVTDKVRPASVTTAVTDSQDSPTATSSRKEPSRKNVPSSPKEEVQDSKVTQAAMVTVTGGWPEEHTKFRTSKGEWIVGKTIGKRSSEGISKVKLGADAERSKKVAIKIIKRPSISAQSEKVSLMKHMDKQVARSANILQLFSHPRICGIEDVFLTHYHWYLVLEFIDGVTLLEHIGQYGRASEKTTLMWSRQLASALDYCHKNYIVHRDIKLEGILVTKSLQLKLFDFGSSSPFSRKTKLDTVCGSLYFAVPEILKRQSYIGPEIDVWGFGVVLYAMICGKVPFEDVNLSKMFEKVKTQAVEFPRFVSENCRRLITRMLEKDPIQRATLDEVMNSPWICDKKYSGPPENHLPYRAPLELPLDLNVINVLVDFDFGTPSHIYTTIVNALSSEYSSDRATVPIRSSNLHKERDGSQASVHTAAKIIDETSSTALPSGDRSDAMIAIYYLTKEKMERDARNSEDPSQLSPINFAIRLKATSDSRSRRRNSTASDSNAKAATNSLKLSKPGQLDKDEPFREGGAQRSAAGQKGQKIDTLNNQTLTLELLEASTESSTSLKKPSSAAVILEKFSSWRRRPS